jgi:hypothetical protein
MFSAIASLVSGFDPVRGMIGFVIFCICVAIVIILGRWLLALAGITIPQPLMIVLGLIVFLVLFLLFLDWVGAFTLIGRG